MNPHPPGLAVSLSHGALVPILKHSSLGSTAPGCLPSSGCSWPCPGGLLLMACGASPHPRPPGAVLAPPRLTPGPAPPASPCTVRFVAAAQVGRFTPRQPHPPRAPGSGPVCPGRKGTLPPTLGANPTQVTVPFGADRGPTQAGTARGPSARLVLGVWV